MASPDHKAVDDSVPRVDNAVAVGENLDFQRAWWRFERVAWIVFSLIIIADIAGVFGSGPLAHAERYGSMMHLQYERIERTSTPSTMTFRFAPAAIQDGNVHLFVSQSVLRELGALRISPQPASSILSDGGMTYVFPATSNKASVEISLVPSLPGVYVFQSGVPGSELITARILVVP